MSLIDPWYDTKKCQTSPAYRNWEFALLNCDVSNDYDKIDDFIDVSTAKYDKDSDNMLFHQNLHQNLIKFDVVN